MLYKSFQREEGKNPTNCLFCFILFLWRSRRPSKDCKSCRNYLQSLAVSSRSSILCLGTAVSGNKFHSLDPPEFVLGVPNQDITENMSAITNVDCAVTLRKTALFLPRTRTRTELYHSTASKGQSQNGLESQAWRKKVFFPLFLILFVQLKNLHFPSLHHQSVTYYLCQKIYTLWDKSPKAKDKTESKIH